MPHRRWLGQAGTPAVDLISEGEERDPVAGLFHETADGLRILQPAMAERLLSAAVSLLGSDSADPGSPLLAAVQTDRQAALFALGRLEAAPVRSPPRLSTTTAPDTPSGAT